MADESGSIGKAYGYQQAKMYEYKGVTEEGLNKAFKNLKIYTDPSTCTTVWSNNYNDKVHIVATKAVGYQHIMMTQLDKAIYDLVNNPFSRRIVVTMWNPADLKEMHLEPCAYEVTFMVTEKNGEEVRVSAYWSRWQRLKLLLMNYQCDVDKEHIIFPYSTITCKMAFTYRTSQNMMDLM